MSKMTPNIKNATYVGTALVSEQLACQWVNINFWISSDRDRQDTLRGYSDDNIYPLPPEPGPHVFNERDSHQTRNREDGDGTYRQDTRDILEKMVRELKYDKREPGQINHVKKDLEKEMENVMYERGQGRTGNMKKEKEKERRENMFKNDQYLPGNIKRSNVKENRERKYKRIPLEIEEIKNEERSLADERSSQKMREYGANEGDRGRAMVMRGHMSREYDASSDKYDEKRDGVEWPKTKLKRDFDQASNNYYERETNLVERQKAKGKRSYRFVDASNDERAVVMERAESQKQREYDEEGGDNADKRSEDMVDRQKSKTRRDYAADNDGAGGGKVAIMKRKESKIRRVYEEGAVETPEDAATFQLNNGQMSPSKMTGDAEKHALELHQKYRQKEMNEDDAANIWAIVSTQCI